MNKNSLFKLLCSIPVILVFLYFIPFLGICLMLFRCYIYKGKKNSLYSTLFIFIIIVIKWNLLVYWYLNNTLKTYTIYPN